MSSEAHAGALFFLAGRALPEVLTALEDRLLPQLLAATGGALAIVLAAQFALSYLSTSSAPIAGVLKTRRAGRGPRRAAAAGVMVWSSTRSVIGLVIALSIPPTLPNGQPFPARELILAVAALMIVCSVLLQGMTLRAVVAWAGLGGEDEQDAEEERARRAMETAHAAPAPSTPTASTPPGRLCCACAKRTASATRCSSACCGKRI